MLSVQLLPDYILRHLSVKILNQQTYTAILWERKGVTPTLAAIKVHNPLTMALKPLAVHGISVCLSPLIWSESLP
jgi:hypothetical protein